MTTVLLALLFAMPQIQPADDVNPLPVLELSDAEYTQAVKLMKYDHFRSQLRAAETRLKLATRFLCVATNSGMPSFALASIRREHEQLQTTVKLHKKNILMATRGDLLHNRALPLDPQLIRRLQTLTNELRAAETRECFAAAFLCVATNSGMPSVALASLRQEHEQVQQTVRTLEDELMQKCPDYLHVSPLAPEDRRSG